MADAFCRFAVQLGVLVRKAVGVIDQFGNGAHAFSGGNCVRCNPSGRWVQSVKPCKNWNFRLVQRSVSLW